MLNLLSMANAPLPMNPTAQMLADRAVTAIFAMEDGEPSLLGMMPLKNINGNSYSWRLNTVLPGINYAAVNESYQTEFATAPILTASLSTVGTDLRVPRIMVETEGPQTRSEQETLILQGIRANLNRSLVKGSQVTNIREFDGLQARLAGSFSETNFLGQIVDNDPSGAGAPLSLSQLDRLVSITRGGEMKVLVMGWTMSLILDQAARTPSVSGYITYSQDQFGLPVMLYRGVPIIKVRQDGSGRDIMPFTEASGDGNDLDCTSIYCLSLGDGGVSLIQGANTGALSGYGLSMRDLNESQQSPEYVTRLDWYLNWIARNPISARRLRGIQDAPAVI